MRVVHVELFVRWAGRIVRSGDVGCCRCWWDGRGSLVGWLSFIIVCVESVIILLIVMPLWSFVGECQFWWCALKSPVIMLLSKVRRWLNKVVFLLSSMSAVIVLGGI